MRFLFLALWFALPIYAMGLGTPLSLARLSKVSGGGGSPPAAPTDLVVTLVNASGVTLGWMNNSMNEDGFWVEYNYANQGWNPVIPVMGSDPNPTAANVVTYFSAVGDAPPDSAPPDFSFTKYRVFATNAFGSSAYSSEVQVPPSVMVSDLDGVVDVLDVNLSWTSTGENATSIDIYRSTDNGMSYSFLSSAAFDATTYLDNGVILSFPAADLRYKLRYLNTGGNGPYSNIATPHL